MVVLPWQGTLPYVNSLKFKLYDTFITPPNFISPMTLRVLDWDDFKSIVGLTFWPVMYVIIEYYKCKAKYPAYLTDTAHPDYFIHKNSFG